MTQNALRVCENLQNGELERGASARSDLIYVVVVAADRKCVHTYMRFASALLNMLAQPHSKHSTHSVKTAKQQAVQCSNQVTGKQRFNPP